MTTEAKSSDPCDVWRALSGNDRYRVVHLLATLREIPSHRPQADLIDAAIACLQRVAATVPDTEALAALRKTHDGILEQSRVTKTQLDETRERNNFLVRENSELTKQRDVAREQLVLVAAERDKAEDSLTGVESQHAQQKRTIQELHHKIHVAGIDLKDSEERVERRNDDIRVLYEWAYTEREHAESFRTILRTARGALNLLQPLRAWASVTELAHAIDKALQLPRKAKTVFMVESDTIVRTLEYVDGWIDNKLSLPDLAPAACAIIDDMRIHVRAAMERVEKGDDFELLDEVMSR